MIKQLAKNYHSISQKSPIGFHAIPYHLQYESRDFTMKNKDYPNSNKERNRKYWVNQFNPYLKTNVSENLSQELKDFYRLVYNKR
jgi:hypothetical protein